VQSVYEVEHWIYYVFDSFHMIFAGRVSADDISGPVGIVTTIDQTVEQAAPAGNTVVAMVLVNFAILLSANLGVMNLLPLPALDGGRLVFLIIEAIRRKPIDREKEGMVHAAGMFLLLALMVFIMFNDVRKLL
jgi:regulator of sigma E protease